MQRLILKPINHNKMSTPETTKQKKSPLEKATEIFDKLTIDDAIETYQSLGEHTHARIEASKSQADQQLKKLKGE